MSPIVGSWDLAKIGILNRKFFHVDPTMGLHGSQSQNDFSQIPIFDMAKISQFVEIFTCENFTTKYYLTNT